MFEIPFVAVWDSSYMLGEGNPCGTLQHALGQNPRLQQRSSTLTPSGHQDIFNGACAPWVEIQTDNSGLQHFDHPVLVLEDNTTLCYFAYILSRHAGFQSRRNTDHEQMARVHWEIGSDNPKPYLASWNLSPDSEAIRDQNLAEFPNLSANPQTRKDA